jgi:branched-subunit amino acid ABC-type transport system permease component
MKATLFITSFITAILGGIMSFFGNDAGGILLTISVFCYAFGSSIKEPKKVKPIENEYKPKI